MQEKAKERIKLCKEYKKKIRVVSNGLLKEYKTGDISYSDYFFKLSKFLKGKTEEQWYSYYDSCIKNLEINIEKPRGGLLEKASSEGNNLLLIALIIIFSLGILFFYQNDIGITGFVVLELGANETINDTLTNITFGITPPINTTSDEEVALVNEVVISSTEVNRGEDLVFETLAANDIPRTISLQGKLTNSSGDVLTDTFTFTFKLYDAYTGGKQWWTENQSIFVHRGIYNVHLGSVDALNLSFNDSYYLGVAVDFDPEMTPRINISTSPYAFRGNVTDYVDIAGDIVPDANETISLGSSLYNFLKLWIKDLFVAGKITSDETIFIDDEVNVTGNVTIGGNLTVTEVIPDGNDFIIRLK